METKHTPLPWVFTPAHNVKDSRYRVEASVTKDGFVLACCPPAGPHVSAWDANAAHIVRCVNSHDAVVAACKDILAAFDALPGACDDAERLRYLTHPDCYTQRKVRDLRSALALALAEKGSQ